MMRSPLPDHIPFVGSSGRTRPKLTCGDAWTLLPTRASAEAWSGRVVCSLFSGIRRHMDRTQAVAEVPDQLDVWPTLAKEATPLIIDEPLVALYTKDRVFVHSPLSAFVLMFTTAGFVSQLDHHLEALLLIPMIWGGDTESMTQSGSHSQRKDVSALGCHGGAECR
eukprot:3200929-Amphidinium_carterae.2